MKFQQEMVVVGAARTPFGRFGGGLKTVDIYELGAMSMRAVLKKSGVRPDQIDEVWWGEGDTSCCRDPYTPVVARQSLIRAGLPETVPSVTLDKACVSGMSSAFYGIGRILLGEAKMILSGGATSFSTVPYLARNLRFAGVKSGGIKLEDPLFPLEYKDFTPVAYDSGVVAVHYGITREMQDELSLDSHRKYGKAYAAGFYNDVMDPVELEIRAGRKTQTVRVEIDEQYRPTISMEDLAKLQPIYGSPTITAGNAPGLNDGSAAQIITTRENAEALGLEPLYTIVDMVSVAAAHELLPVAPALAIKKILTETGVKLEDVDLIEINEAFAAVPLVSLKLLACKAFREDSYENCVRHIADYPTDTFEPAFFEELLSRLNVNGGAIAIGHANTASGARIMINAGMELRRRGGGLALCAICGGLTQGDGCLIRV